MDKELVLIDSAHNERQDHNPLRVSLQDDIYASSVRLVHFSTPNVFYNITTHNNTVQVDIGGGNVAITLPSGKYTFNQLVASLVAALNNDANVGVGNPWTDLGFNDITKRWTLENSAIDFTIDFGLMGRRLGFSNNVQYASQTVGANEHLSSVQSPEVEDNEMYLDVCEFRSLKMTTGQVHYHANFLVPNNAAENDIIFYNATEGFEQRNEVSGSTVRVLNITLRDSEGNTLENVGHWNAVLDFQVQPREHPRNAPQPRSEFEHPPKTDTGFNF